MKKLILPLLFVLSNLSIRAQEPQDTRMVGIVSFATNTSRFQDSLSSRMVYATVSRLLVQTKRFTVLEVDKWKKTQDEIDRQKGEAFLEQEIIASGKSLGARILVIGYVKNAELYQDAGMYSARIDYELKFVDVQTGKSIAAQSFTGDSEKMLNITAKAGKGLRNMLMPSLLTGKGNWKAVYITSAGLTAMSEADKKAINGKLVDAIESTDAKLNAWIRNTFNFNLLFLELMKEDGDKKKDQYVLIEGGEDIGMREGYNLKLVLVTEKETSRGKIRDEAPVAEIEVNEVRAQTSKCKVTKVIKGSKSIAEVADNKNLLVVFD